MQILDKKTLSTEDMAKLVIELIPDYASINLGIGMPTMIAEILPSDKFLVLVISGFLFKVIVAILDTPLLYFFVWLFRKKFDLKVGEEIKMD